MTMLVAPPCRHVIAFVGLGSNLGDRLGHLRQGVEQLAALSVGIRTSGVYECSYVGPPGASQPDYLNAVAECVVTLAPDELLVALLGIECSAGRPSVNREGPRVLDLDLLLYGSMQSSTACLDVPHPRMWARAFVMAPLSELAPRLSGPDGEPVHAKAVRLMREQAPIRRIPASLPFALGPDEQVWEHAAELLRTDFGSNRCSR